MAVNWVFPVRVVQAVFSIIALGLSAYVADKTSSPFQDSPSQVNFMVFCTVWSLLAVIFLLLAPRYDAGGRHIGHKFIILAVDAVTAIFYFAAFIALAVKLGHPNCGHDKVCGSWKGAISFGAFLWILFTATAVLDGIHVFRTYGTHDTKPASEIQASQGV